MPASTRSSCFQFIRLLAISIIVIAFSGCRESKPVEQWDTVIIDPRIAGDSVYTRMNKENELFSAHEKQDSSIRRSSDVAYSKSGKGFIQNNDYLKFNNCRSYFFNSDTLTIDIGIASGLGGQGFVIRYKNNMFYTKPYFVTDVIVSGEPLSTYKLEYQRLTLDKASYKIGDSVYGRIDFKSIETRKKEKTVHTGIGYFRAKVGAFHS